MLAWTPLFPVDQGKKVWIETFESGVEGALPKQWKGRTKNAGQHYKLKIHQKPRRQNRMYLEARVVNADELIAKDQKVDIVKYPYLNWRWRVHVLPPDGNESLKPLCDSAASIYVVIRARKTMGVPTPESIKYSWSSTLKVGTVTKSPYSVWPSRCDIIVLQSGDASKNRWITEKRNVLADYKKFYKKTNPKSVLIDGVAIMSDSDNTKSQSWADYDQIYFSER